MGIIDTNNYTLKCESCGTIGTAKVHDRGDSYSGSFWQSRGDFDDFNSVWKQEKPGSEPEFISATCKKCSKPATLQSKKYTQ